MKNCWDILGIEPTTDKKIIKRAYAAKTREIHPEERPEEFKQLYEEYQAALGYADYFLRIERIEAETGRPYKSSSELADEVLDEKRTETEVTGECEEGNKELISFFKGNRDRQKPRVDAFLQYWSEIQSPRDDPKMLDWWKEYLASEEFQDIRYQPQVLYVLARELDKKFFYRLNDLKILFWDAYEFQEGQESAYQGDMRQIWKSLYPAYKKQRRTIQKEQKLLSHFEEMQERKEQHIGAFLQYWNEMQSPYRNPEMLEWWKTYLSSEEFQEIRYHSQVLHLLAEEIDNKFFYGINEVKILFWEAYGFKEDERDAYQGDLQRLWRSLYPAWVKQQENRQRERQAARSEKIIRIFAGISVVVIASVCIVTFIGVRRRRAEGLQYLVDYMAGQYTDTSFSEPEQSKKLNDGSVVYTMHAMAHPELQITAKLEDTYVEGIRTFVVTEDYDKLLLEYYAAQYGLEAGRVSGVISDKVYTDREYSLLFYEDIEQVDDFCETVERMFSEQEELQEISETAVCTDSVVFPKILLQGGVAYFPFNEPQIYDLRTMKASELAAVLRENYMIYMFQYESWNITPVQYREWGAAYEELCGKWADDEGEWHEVYDPETGEYLCRLFIFTYDYVAGTYSIEGISAPAFKRAVTVGNAYYYLQERGADLTEYGTGFQVEFYGDIKKFGEEPQESFYELRNWY